MKLYATTTSERASKGQGGQEYIEIELKDKEKALIHIRAIPDGTYTRLFIRVYDKVDFEKTFYIPTTKGKSQKGECPVSECKGKICNGLCQCPCHEI